MNKRGLSRVVSTILLVLLVLTAIAGLWVVINNFLIKGSSSIGLGSFSVDLAIQHAKINYSDGLATVTVVRNAGISNAKIKSVKFIVEDTRNSDIFDVPAENFRELTKRTFVLNLSKSKILNVSDVYKISVAAVYVLGTNGKGIVSPITSKYNIDKSLAKFGPNTKVNKTIVNNSKQECVTNSDCGTDAWVPNSKFCSASNSQLILQYKKVYECLGGFCQNKTQSFQISSCSSGEICYSGACISKDIPCTPENVSIDCGVNGFIGFPSCNPNPPPEKIIQDYSSFSCVNNSCQENITSKTITNCSSSQICSSSQGSPSCFTPLQCTTNGDCSFGDICSEGSCIPESFAINGTISSIWPPNLGEYFNSNDLPKKKGTINYVNYNIIFPGSKETRCLKVLEFVYPENTSDDSYIRLNEKNTSIKSGDTFELWETTYGCTQI